MYLVLLFAPQFLWFVTWSLLLPQWPRFETLVLPQFSPSTWWKSKNFLKIFVESPDFLHLSATSDSLSSLLLATSLQDSQSWSKFFPCLLRSWYLLQVWKSGTSTFSLPLEANFKFFCQHTLLLWLLVLTGKKYFLHLIPWTSPFSFLCLNFTICKVNQNL